MLFSKSGKLLVNYFRNLLTKGEGCFIIYISPWGNCILKGILIYLMKKQKNFYPLILLLFGALTALPFLVGKLWFISWFSLIPLAYRFLAHSDGMRLRTAFGSGYLFGMGYFGVMYHWFTAFYPMDFAGLTPNESIGVIALCWFGLSTLHSLELGTAMLVYRLVKPSKNRPYIGVLTLSACWATFEWLQTIGWRGVPWGRLALSQWDVLPMIQSASLFGGVFVSAIMVAFNGLMAVVVLKYKAHNAEDPHFIRTATDGIKEVLIKAWRRAVSLFKSETAVRIYSCVAVGIFALNLLFGVVRMAAYDETEGRAVKVGAIQGNISSLDKWADNSVSNSTSVYLDLTRRCVEETGAELVLWAETSIPVMIDKYTSYKRKIANTADELDITIIIGSFENKVNPDTGELDEYNALIAFLPDGSELDTRYYKRHLVPFAESLPLESFIRTFLPILVELNLISEPLAAGTSANIFKTPVGNVGGIICFDSIFPELSVDAVRNGAELLAVSTNDSWFADSGALQQHNHQSAMRAIETGRYVVRSANTGVSSVITSEGVYLDQLEPLVEGYAAATVYMRSDSTLYVIIGDAFAYLCAAFVAVSLGYGVYRKVRQKVKR